VLADALRTAKAASKSTGAIEGRQYSQQHTPVNNIYLDAARFLICKRFETLSLLPRP
jgi:hypothetical protein